MTDETDELFVKDKYNWIYDDDRQADVYTFADNEARDNWLDVASGYGTEVLNEGDGWLEAAD